MAGYNIWIYHGGNVNAIVSSNVPEQNLRILKRNKMFDVLNDIISDGAEVDPIGVQSTSCLQH